MPMIGTNDLHNDQRYQSVCRERDAYKKAKEENDERFMRERDEAREELASAKSRVHCLEVALDKISDIIERNTVPHD